MYIVVCVRAWMGAWSRRECTVVTQRGSFASGGRSETVSRPRRSVIPFASALSVVPTAWCAGPLRCLALCVLGVLLHADTAVVPLQTYLSFMRNPASPSMVCISEEDAAAMRRYRFVTSTQQQPGPPTHLVSACCSFTWFPHCAVLCCVHVQAVCHLPHSPAYVLGLVSSVERGMVDVPSLPQSLGVERNALA